MAEADYTITASEWTPISSAGQSGTAHLVDFCNEAVVHVAHGTSAPALSSIKGARCFIQQSNDDLLILEADGVTDIFYARVVSGKGSACLRADMVNP